MQKRRMRRKGFQSKSLRQTFNYYKRRLNDQLLYEYAQDSARGGGRPFGIPKTLFKNLDYDRLMNEGITRKIGNRTIRITGEQAVKIQIESLKKRSSKIYLKDAYIKNYLNTMRQMGFNNEQINRVRSAFRKVSADRLTYLINSGVIKSIQFLYGESYEFEDRTQEIVDSINKGTTSEDFYKTQARFKKFKNFYKTQFDILKEV